MPKLSAGENETLHNASSKLEIRSTAECGNFAVANDEIKAGETITVEEPIAACLLPKYFGSHCLHCLRRYINQMPKLFLRIFRMFRFPIFQFQI